MYTKEQREKALALYDKCHSVTKVIQVLGCPESRQGLYLWLRQRNATPKKKAERRIVNNSPKHCIYRLSPASDPDSALPRILPP